VIVGIAAETIASGSMDHLEQLVRNNVMAAQSRMELWMGLMDKLKTAKMAEIGVYRGDFAASLLKQCKSIQTYYMVDPWKHLDDWNKPANKEDKIFEEFLSETKAKTEFAGERRVILRGKTTEVISQIPDESLDFVYIDGDHTLRGITIDLIQVYRKIRPGGFIGGDDFSASPWQHETSFEPTLVFPFAVYFAEAMDFRIFALPHNQFLIEKQAGRGFEFIDVTGKYGDRSLRGQFRPGKVLKLKLAEAFRHPMRKILGPKRSG
jgi:hypothetical protein